jgi:hypothetical protein
MTDQTSPTPPAPGPTLVSVPATELRRGDVVSTGIQVLVPLELDHPAGVAGWLSILTPEGDTERTRLAADAVVTVTRTPEWAVLREVDISEVEPGDVIVDSPKLVLTVKHGTAGHGSAQRSAAHLTVQGRDGEPWSYKASTSPVTIVRGCQVPPTGRVDGCQVPAHDVLDTVRRAWVDAGRAPGYHRAAQASLRKSWPALAQALDLLEAAGAR